MKDQKKILALIKKLKTLEKSALALEVKNKALLKHIHPAHLVSARNLLHYLALRSVDLRSLQKELSGLAISSISHSESYTLLNLSNIIFLLSALAGISPEERYERIASLKESENVLKKNATALFGKAAFEGQSKIMVTLPTEAGDDFGFVCNLVKTGMHIARINTAHDDQIVWKKMIRNVNKAARVTRKKVNIYMDMEGPKIRTGKIQSASREPETENAKKPFIILYKGNKLILTKSSIEGQVGAHPSIPLTSSEVFRYVKRKEYVWFDDGKLGGVISSVDANKIVVEIDQAPEEGFKLRAEKGVNFPDSYFDFPALTKDDLIHLDFIAKYADMVGYSFVQKPHDIELLQKQLKRLKREDIGIILKIETRLAFDNLSALLLAVMKSQNCGIMIARGDLAVAIGYLRIAEVQEEILWLSEAAHLPVIWATQVLETQVKKGIATRAEISDVVKAVRAECVMLNKGPHILEAINTIKNIDRRMAAHEDKKRKTLRSLHVAQIFVK